MRTRPWGAPSSSSFGGVGAIPIWDKDWSFHISCRLVPYQTAFSALAPGEEYVDRIGGIFNLKIDRFVVNNDRFITVIHRS